MKQTIYACVLTILLFTGKVLAQKGHPAKPEVTITHSTNYPQHVDFKPSMVNQLKVAAGWKVMVAASGLGKPRMLCLGPQGELYVTRRDAGDVLLLKDLNNDGEFDEMQTVVADFKGVHGIAIRDGWLYCCNNRELKKYKLNADGTTATVETVINNLPDGGQHSNRVLRFGPDGMLYLSIGSTCNDCFESNKENATIIRIDPVTWKREVYARGLRNTICFDWQPGTGALYGVDNGADAKGDNLPPEELNRIEKDSDYGWPLVYGKQVPDGTREDPPGTTKAIYATTTVPPVLEFPAHSAPIGFAFFNDADSIASGYRGDALVCWHGSWNRKQPVGYKVQRINFQDGKATGADDFLSGFLSTDQRSRFGRPAGLVISPSGVVYVSDDANGIIYCVKQMAK